MGRPFQIKPLPAGTTRRGFLRTSGGAAAALAVALALVAAAGGARTVGQFQHDVASGDPLSDRVILWTPITPPNAVSALLVTYVWPPTPA